jgi:diguanylate cyclase (GGDEF)-like protein
MAPAIEWNRQVVIGTVVIAICASATALGAFFLGRGTRRGRGFQFVSAAVMGGLVCAMHCAGIAAAGFAGDSSCLNEEGLSGRNLGGLLVACGVAVVGAALLAGMLETQLRARTSGLSARLRSANERLRQRALRDPLTSLPNRLLFDKLMSQALKRLAATVAEGREGAKIVVLFIDLDGFKPVNDRHGHAAGDAILKAIAATLIRNVRASDTVARLGGDEFAVILWNLSEADAAAKAIALEEAVAQAAVIWEAETLSVGASIGLSMLGPDDEFADVLAKADRAMYARKARRKGNILPPRR